MNERSDPSTPSDDTLLELLGAALQVADPVPEHVLAAARGAVAWRTIDQDLADLVFDSAVELTGVRDRDSARQLTFRTADLEIELMVVDPASRRLVGQLVPPLATSVTLESTSESAVQHSDAYGRFTFEAIADGPVRLAVGGAEGRADVLTDWVLL
ncbi:hypothetical protein [Desertimonas flava]|jgi:hypothetical protein|uniref:hypothetical protein n=1 Tax=Desertimonas flava TaxID=2064846 RepID=UPI000E3560FA|nr:hypothetical protein [Desertimonas flava]